MTHRELNLLHLPLSFCYLSFDQIDNILFGVIATVAANGALIIAWLHWRAAKRPHGDSNIPRCVPSAVDIDYHLLLTAIRKWPSRVWFGETHTFEGCDSRRGTRGRRLCTRASSRCFLIAEFSFYAIRRRWYGDHKRPKGIVLVLLEFISVQRIPKTVKGSGYFPAFLPQTFLPSLFSTVGFSFFLNKQPLRDLMHRCFPSARMCTTSMSSWNM